MFRKAERKKSKLRMFVYGISGSGKTCSALRIAKGMGGTIGMGDTERGGDLYSEFDFILEEIKSPYTPEKFIDFMKLAEKEKIENLIIDNFSHFWAGEGGILEIHDNITRAMARPNPFSAWKDVTPTQNKIINSIINYPGNIICCARAKKDYVLSEGGKNVTTKVAKEPIQRPDVEYEFRVVLEITHGSHLAEIQKDLTHTLPTVPFLVTEEHGKLLKAWIETGDTIEELSTSDLQLEEIKTLLAEKGQSLNKIQKAEVWDFVEKLKSNAKAQKVIECLKISSLFDYNSYITLVKGIEDEF